MILNQEREEFDGRTGMFQVKMLFVIFFRCQSLRQNAIFGFPQICEQKLTGLVHLCLQGEYGEGDPDMEGEGEYEEEA